MQYAKWTALVVLLGTAGCRFVINGLANVGPGDSDSGGGGGDVDLGEPADLADDPADLLVLPPPDLTPPTGALAGSLDATAVTLVDLTVEGTTDWAHWGLANSQSFDHKSGVNAISDFTLLQGGNGTRLTNYPTGFSWVGGTPTATATSTNTGVYANGQNQGFRITVPADTTQRKLRIYAGGQQSTVTVTAHLSDGSATDYVDSATDANSLFTRVITLTYRAASAGQTLRVDWVVTSASGFVHVQSASLQ